MPDLAQLPKTVKEMRLQMIADDPDTIEALKDLFDIPAPKPAMINTNEQIGAIFRAHEEAKRLVDAAFAKLASLKTNPIITSTNPAR